MINKPAMSGLRRKVSEAIWDSVAGALTLPEIRHQTALRHMQPRLAHSSRNLIDQSSQRCLQPNSIEIQLRSEAKGSLFTQISTYRKYVTNNVQHSLLRRASSHQAIGLNLNWGSFTGPSSSILPVTPHPRPTVCGALFDTIGYAPQRPTIGMARLHRLAPVMMAKARTYKGHTQIAHSSSKSSQTQPVNSHAVKTEGIASRQSHRVHYSETGAGVAAQASEQQDAPPQVGSHDPGILGRIAHIHRPTKDEMLAAATGIFQRLRIRMKWTLIRQMRPYNLEDIAAFLQWLLVGHIIWVLVGTTTFFSIVLYLANTVSAQGII